MAFLLKKQFDLPYDICNKLNEICLTQRNREIIKKILHMELISHFQVDVVYPTHEFYFIKLITFLNKLKPIIPKYNDEYEIYEILLRDESINLFQYRLYKDHINIYAYQNKEYVKYYNLSY